MTAPLLLILTAATLCLVLAETTTDTPCSEKLFESGIIQSPWIQSSSEQRGTEASHVWREGWCAVAADSDRWIEIEFPNFIGIKGFITAPPESGTSYPKNILVQYVPPGESALRDFPGRKMELQYDKPTNATYMFTQGVAMDSIRFTLQNWSGDPCLKLELLGCQITELCRGGCENEGVCVAEDDCKCTSNYTGSRCDIQACHPSPLGLSDGRISSGMVTVSSEATLHEKDQLGNTHEKYGWCPLASDKAPWVEIKLAKPMAVSVFHFSYASITGEYMNEFELKYIVPSDSSRTYRTFANHILCLNGTHPFVVTTIPSIVTDTIRIEPDSVVVRACFKLEIDGCDPTSLCSTDWCQNGGSCMGENVCACPSGYFGDSCRETKTDIKETNLVFLKIEHNVIQTATINFIVTGHAILIAAENYTALLLNVTNSYITLNQSTTGKSCLTDIDHCKSGFTFGIDINFGSLHDNTFIVSSGGNLRDHKGLALYYTGNTLVYIVSTATQIWQLTVTYQPVISTWQHFEITWSKNLGLGLFLDGRLLGTHGQPASQHATQTVDLCIGCSHASVNVQINMMVKEFHTWNIDRTELVNAGIKAAPVAIPAKTTTAEMTTISKGTTQQITKITTNPSSTLKSITSMVTKATTTPTTTPKTATTKPTTPVKTTAKPPTTTTTQATSVTDTASSAKPTTPAKTTIDTVPSAKPTTPGKTKADTRPSPTTSATTSTNQQVTQYTWDLTNIMHNNHITGNNYTLSAHGGVAVKDGGLEISNSSQYIDFGSTHKVECLLNPAKCAHGLTVKFQIKFSKLEENTYLLTSGGERPNGIGVAVVYAYGRVQFVVSTNQHSWFASCGRGAVTSSGYHTIMISWHHTTGLYVYIDNRLIDWTNTHVLHTTTSATATHAFFGKSSILVTTALQVKYIVKEFTVWHTTLEVLIQKGICKPPKTDKPTTAIQTTPAPKTTHTIQSSSPSKETTVKGTTLTKCPAGCVSIDFLTTTKGQTTTGCASTTSSTPTMTSAKEPATPTNTIAPPPPNTASPTVKPVTPSYNGIPSVYPITGKDGHGYIACTFAGAAEQNVEFIVSLVIDEKVVLEKNINRNTGITMFAVSEVDKNLYNTKIQCSIKARFLGNSLTTKTTSSNILIPGYKVTPNAISVTEGHSAGHVTVTSTAPPQFYCCRGCKGQCHVHITGSFIRHDQKCGNKFTAQTVFASTTPPHYTKPICGFALTTSNWNLVNAISVVATLDGRRDGDHTNTVSIQAHVYNQPTSAQITVQPTSFQITTVRVTAKDTYHGAATCKSVNDPHMTTFDGQRYNNMHTGEFVLYRHTTMPFEVRAKYQPCSSRSHATCNCAVSVKSGDDVITVTGCQATTDNGYHGFGHHGHHGHGHHDRRPNTPMTIQIYKNGELTPGTYIRRYGCGQKYEIELPTGTLVTVQQSFKPFINIWIKASAPDWGHTTGLCGSYDGNRRNDMDSSTAYHIVHWKADVRSTFFHGVSASSQTVGANYCSCVKGKDSICTYGLGAITCAKSRYDITGILLRQALRPANTRHRRQTQANETEIVDVFQQDTNITKEEADKFCTDAILNSTITKSCKPILTSNISHQIENCVHDYEATGSKVWAQDALRDVVVDCIEEVRILIDLNNTANASAAMPDIPENIEVILSNMCLEECGMHGKCSGGICECNDGYSGISCNISKDTTPSLSVVPILCDTEQTSDCTTATVFGDDFVNSADLTCHYEYISIGETIIRRGTQQAVAAAYISLNHIACILPSGTSAYIQVSNDGQTLSDDAAVHVVYDSVCHECTVDMNNTFAASCTRRDGNCVIDGVCHTAGDTKSGESCLVCRPESSVDSWSSSMAPECIAKPLSQNDDDDLDRTKIIILAVVCAVFGALLVVGVIYIIRLRTGKGKKKSETGEYDVSEAYKNDKGSTHDYDALHHVDKPSIRM